MSYIFVPHTCLISDRVKTVEVEVDGVIMKTDERKQNKQGILGLLCRFFVLLHLRITVYVSKSQPSDFVKDSSTKECDLQPGCCMEYVCNSLQSPLHF